MFCPARRAKKIGISSWAINITKTVHLINSKILQGEFYATTAPGFWKMNLVILLKMCLKFFYKNVMSSVPFLTSEAVPKV